MIKKGDYAVFAIILAASIALFAAFFVFGNAGSAVNVKVGSKVYGKYSLAHNQKINIKTKYGNNTLVIKNGEAWFEDSNCSDKTCENMGKISKNGQTIVCLPHRIVAEVKR